MSTKTDTNTSPTPSSSSDKNKENIEKKDQKEEENITKSFGTVLKGEDKEIDEKLNNLPSVYKRLDMKLPESFDGSIIWRNYLSNIFKQGACGYCWAISTCSVVSDRFALYTGNQINETLSNYEIIACSFTDLDASKIKYKYGMEIDKNILYKKTEKKKKCDGNSVYNALCYLYVYGVTSNKCVNIDDINKNLDKNYKRFIDYEFDIPNCDMLLGDNYDSCSDTHKAPRFYRIKNFYLVDSDEDQIKYEIYKFGPVIAGFKIFDSFLEGYDGTTIYTGPKKGEKSHGGHAIRIIGWGVENGIKYWLCSNSWGQSWGLNGLFKMKMNIPECQLEDNIYGVIPDIPHIKIPDYLDIGFSVDRLNKIRRLVKINNETGYKKSTITKILRGELAGDLTYLVSENFQIDLANFIAADVDQNRSPLYEKSQFPIDESYLKDENPVEIYFILFLLTFVLFNTIFIRLFLKK